MQLLPIPAYECMLCLHLFMDNLQHGPRLWHPLSVLYGTTLYQQSITLTNDTSLATRQVDGITKKFISCPAY